ncbi:hypothetical protein [Fusobacterium animalis]|uniref:hypothetical protein n=1 Tax=Fusobacterium animalis TaxID=76859 RepID=UPI0030D3C900
MVNTSKHYDNFECNAFFSINCNRKFLKIKTSYKIFSFGILIEIEEYKKIRAVIKEKLKI